MREILFRGKRIGNGEWVEGSLYIDPDLKTASIWWFGYSQDGMERWEEAESVDPETVGQFTRLTDTNGRKIFEGDIVRLTDELNEFGWTAVITFGNPNGWYDWGWQLKPIGEFDGNKAILFWVDMENAGAYCEVIGNIHDNPELLEVSE